jgi:hypothetical protein
LPWRFTYLLLGGLVCLGALVVFAVRPDLRRPIVTTGLIGAAVEAVAELWYLQDYWRPPTLLPWPTPEDLLYGFGVTALATCAVPFWLRRQYVPYTGPRTHRGWAAVPLCGLGATLLIGYLFPIVPSIWVVAIAFRVSALLAFLVRHDLWWAGLAAGVIMGVVATIGYGIGLNYVIDGKAFLDHVLLLHGCWDIRILGNIPLDEIAWNIARGWCVAMLYPLLTTQRLEPLRPKAQK